MAQSVLILHPYLKRQALPADELQAALDEAVGLAQAISVDVVAAMLVPLAAPKPATLFGSGKVDELAELVEEHGIELVVVNYPLTPIQQRNLEKCLSAKVIDRTALILEIFGARARTAEGKLQVELASLSYQKTRLVRSWTHLERQRGGFGFLGGPGESQIEIDRRLIRDRIAKIKKELVDVVRTRELHGKARRRVPYPVVALVGYTNAGKSTLFNRITGAQVVARDQLFATLDPTMRLATLPSGREIILSDTVGFISDLPHELVAAFRATLEEVLEADMVLHVRDISHPDTQGQKKAVEQVLSDLFEHDNWRESILEVGNKSDLLAHGLPTEATEAALAERPRIKEEVIHISAITGEGVPELLSQVEQRLDAQLSITALLRIPASDGKAHAWLYANGQVISKQLEEDEYVIEVRLSPARLQQYHRQFHE